MLTLESVAKTKWCPYGRTAVRFPDGKASSGVNLLPTNTGLMPITKCLGTGCMLFHVVSTHTTTDDKKKCVRCNGEGGKVKDCQTCKGKGTLSLNDPIGFCGAGADAGIAIVLEQILAKLPKESDLEQLP